MNVLSLQVKANTAEDIGRKLEKVQEGLEQDIFRLKGALQYLTKVEKDLIPLIEKVKRDVLGEDPSVELTDSLSVAKYIIEKVMECSATVHGQMERVAAAIPITEGKKSGVAIALKDLHEVYTGNRDRVVKIEEQLAKGELIVDARGNVFPANIEQEDEEELLTCHPSMFKAEDSEIEKSEEQSQETLDKESKGTPKAKKKSVKSKGKGTKKASEKLKSVRIGKGAKKENATNA